MMSATVYKLGRVRSPSADKAHLGGLANLELLGMREEPFCLACPYGIQLHPRNRGLREATVSSLATHSLIYVAQDAADSAAHWR